MIKVLFTFGFLTFSSAVFGQLLVIPRSIPDKLTVPDNLPNPGIDLEIPFDYKAHVPMFKGQGLKLGKIVRKPNLAVSEGFSSNMKILDMSRGFSSNMPVKEFPGDFPSNMPIIGITPPAAEIIIPPSNK
jgi:hypothetical protein